MLLQVLVYQKLLYNRYINTISSLESTLLDLDVFIIDPNRPLTNDTVKFNVNKSL